MDKFEDAWASFASTVKNQLARLGTLSPGKDTLRKLISDLIEDAGVEVFVLTIQGGVDPYVSLHLNPQRAKDEVQDFEPGIILTEWYVDKGLLRCTGKTPWETYDIQIARHFLTVG